MPNEMWDRSENDAQDAKSDVKKLHKVHRVLNARCATAGTPPGCADRAAV